MIIFGIDLSSPTNLVDTAMAKFEESANGNDLICISVSKNQSDQHIIDEIIKTAREGNEIVVGLDCPLSYQDGGGSRPSDNSLRDRIKKRTKKNPLGISMDSRSVMAPASLYQISVRGMHISRILEDIKRKESLNIDIVEVHPGATIGLHMTEIRPLNQIPYEVPICVLDYKKDKRLPTHQVLHYRRQILLWMETVMQMINIPSSANQTSHEVDSCAAALAAWKWTRGTSVWQYPSNFPSHPYDFSC